MKHSHFVDERIYAPYKIAALIETLAENGIPAEQSLVGTELRSETIYDPATRCSIRDFGTVCSNAMRLTKDPSVPFRAGTRMHLSSYGMYGHALLCCLTLRDSLDFAVKYHRLVTPTVTMCWRKEGSAAIWFYPNALMPDTTEELYRFLVELQFTETVTHMKDVAGSGFAPRRAYASFPRPPHARLYKDYLGCPVVFDQFANELHYDANSLDQPPRLANRITANLLRETCDRLLAEVHASAGLANQVRQLLLQTRGGFPDIERVALSLGMTSRTLRRKLRVESTSFQEILSDVRCTLAIGYLRTTRMNTHDIAAALGFSDAANFRHALKRWTDKTPSDYR